MYHRCSIAALLIIIGHLTLVTESVIVKGRLRNFLHNTKCLHPKGPNNGDELEIVDCSVLSPDQVIEASGFQTLQSQAGYIQFDVGGKCLSLSGFSSDNGVHVLMWDCVNQDNQRWKIINGDSQSSFQLQLRSTGKCLTAEGGGSYLDQWDCIGTQAAPHQSWTLDVVQLSEPAVPPPIDTTNLSGMLRNFQYNTKCIHAVGGDNGAELEIVDCSQLQKDQLLKMDSFQDMENEPGYIQFQGSGKCLSLNGFSSDNGVRILTWDCVNQDNQKWTIVNGDSGGPFQLQLRSTGKCLTAEGGGTYMDQWDCFGTQGAPHQSWTLDVVQQNAR